MRLRDSKLHHWSPVALSATAVAILVLAACTESHGHENEPNRSVTNKRFDEAKRSQPPETAEAPPKGCFVYLVSGDNPKYGDQLGLSLYHLAKNVLSVHTPQTSTADATASLETSLAAMHADLERITKATSSPRASLAAVTPDLVTARAALRSALSTLARPREQWQTYPVLVFHDHHLRPAQIERLRASAAAGLKAGDSQQMQGVPGRVDLRFVPVNIGFPQWLLEDPQIELENYSFVCKPYPPFPLRYLQMNRFFTWKLYTQPELAGFDYYMRIDCDTVHFETPPTDPFRRMRSHNWTFAFLRQALDPPCVYEGLYEAVGEYIALKGLRPLGAPQHRQVFNGFVGVGDLRFFRSPDYLDFAKFLNEEKRGVFTARWSDQQIYPIALALFRPSQSVAQWQTQGPDGTPSGYPAATHIHGKFWRSIRPALAAEYAAAMSPTKSQSTREETDRDSSTATAPGTTQDGGTIELSMPDRRQAEHAAMDQALDVIQQHQNPVNCDGVRFLAFQYRKVGLGSEMHSISVALSIASRTGRVLVVDTSSWPELLTGCSLNSHTCFFKPLTSTCRPSQEEINQSIVYSPDKGGQDLHRVLRFDLKAAVGRTKWRYHYVPPTYRGEGKSELWYRSMLLRYILRPTDELQRAVESERQKLLPNNVSAAAVHVRRTDGHLTGVQPLPLDQYVSALQEIILDSGVSHVLVATDDIAVVHGLRQLPSTHGLQFVALDSSHRNNTSNRNKIFSYRDGTRDPKPDYWSAALDLFLAARCEYFVGQYTSNFSRLVLELIYGRIGERAIKQTRSLDSEWFVNP
eukprot:m.474074 g.474074  ORF g.474074 m.474074 type:complete len:805 (-) comp35715_c0_seq1:64-2478(-)